MSAVFLPFDSLIIWHMVADGIMSAGWACRGGEQGRSYLSPKKRQCSSDLTSWWWPRGPTFTQGSIA